MAYTALITIISILGVCLGNESSESKKSIMTARCRSSCLKTFMTKGEYGSCFANSDCYMCWDTCNLFYTNAKIKESMCKEKKICFPGCQESCRFFETPSPQMSNGKIDREADLKFDADSPKPVIHFRWTHTETESPLVYVLDAFDELTNSWEQLKQTVHPGVTIRRSLVKASSKIRLTAYDIERKVIEVEKACSTSGPKSDGDHMLLDEKIGSKGQPTEFWNSWSPQINSLQYSRKTFGSVEALISWSPLQEEVEHYEVIWKLWEHSFESTSVLRTQNSLVKITLWPNSAYTLKVVAHLKGRKRKLVQGNTIIINSSENLLGVNPFDKQCEEDRDACLRTDYLISFALAVTAVFLFGIVLYLLTEKKPRQWARSTINRARNFERSSFKKRSLKEQLQVVSEIVVQPKHDRLVNDQPGCSETAET